MAINVLVWTFDARLNQLVFPLETNQVPLEHIREEEVQMAAMYWITMARQRGNDAARRKWKTCHFGSYAFNRFWTAGLQSADTGCRGLRVKILRWTRARFCISTALKSVLVVPKGLATAPRSPIPICNSAARTRSSPGRDIAQMMNYCSRASACRVFHTQRPGRSSAVTNYRICRDAEAQPARPSCEALRGSRALPHFALNS